MLRQTVATRARNTTLALLALCTFGICGPASAQFGLRERPIGKVLGLPLLDFGPFIAANVIRGNNVNFLHLSQVAAGDFNTQIVTVGVTQRNTNQPANTIYIPTRGLGVVPNIYKQINSNETLIEQTAIGSGNTQVAQVDVSQSNELNQAEQRTYAPGLTRFFLVPASGLPTLKSANVQKNINRVDVIQTAVGDANTQVALVAVDQRNAGNLQVPGGALVNAMININTNVVVQTAVGTGNTQVATVGVSQQNAPTPTP
jgi:hypothetical protein